jgi:cytochrome c1
VFELLPAGKLPPIRGREGDVVAHHSSRACLHPPTLLSAALGLVVAIVVASCASTPSREPPPQVPGGDPRRGAAAIDRYGCGSCHVIPGIRGADGTVGPPLTDFAHRGYIAGELPNNGGNLIRWIMDPRVVEPGTDMPDLDIGEAEARDIAAYLFTLGR